ncbi:MAG: ZIP family metal transporter [Candidatus Bilamarchaeaceae archaeon]
MEPIIFGALIVLLATSAGALGVLFFRRFSQATYSAMLAFSSGVMAFTAIEMLYGARGIGDSPAVFGFLLGVACIFVFEKLLPHIHLHLRKTNLKPEKKKTALLVGTIAIHNIPEGFAIASAFAGSAGLGYLVTASMALQDIPEGLLISVPVLLYGVRMRKAILFGVLSGLVEAFSAIAGFMFLGLLGFLTPYALAFSSGAMAYVVLVELLPDALKAGSRRIAGALFLFGAAVGFLLANYLVFSF